MKDKAEFYAVANFNGIGIGIHMVDAREIDKLRIAITSTIAEMFIDYLRVKTRRGLAARFNGGGSRGGHAYGFTKAQLQGEDVPVKSLVIVPEEAEVSLRIFHTYAEDQSPTKIAAALNRDGVPAPEARSGSGHWMQNTINGHVQGGTGNLNNEVHIGRRVWNRLDYRRLEARLAPARPRRSA